MHKKMLAALALSAGLALSACGDGNDDENGGGDDAATPVPAETSPVGNGEEAPAGEDQLATPLPEGGE